MTKEILARAQEAEASLVLNFAMGIDQRGAAENLAFRLSESASEEQVKLRLKDLFHQGLQSPPLLSHVPSPGSETAGDWVAPYAKEQRGIFPKQCNLRPKRKQAKNKKSMLKGANYLELYFKISADVFARAAVLETVSPPHATSAA